MFDIAPTELLIVALVALVVIGPKDLPKTDYVIVWFTSLAPDGSRFRASLDEITLS